MSDDASDPTKRPERTFRAPLSGRGRVKIYLDEDAGAADRAKGFKGGRGPTSEGMLHADRSEDEYVIPSARPFAYFHDLATELLPSGVAEYRERNPFLEIGKDYDPNHPQGITYTDEDYKAWQDELLGSLLSGDEDDSNPTGTWPIESSPRGRRAPQTWPWNNPGMDNFAPPLQFTLKPGVTNPADGGGGSLYFKRVKQVDVTGETWSPNNTTPDLAPDYTYWKIPERQKFEHLIVSLNSRYVGWRTDHAAYKVTEEPHFEAPEVAFKLDWPLRAYAVPSLFNLDESAGFQFTPGAGVGYNKAQVIERGFMNTTLGPKPYTVTVYTRESSTFDFFSSHGWGEYSLYPLQREPLFPVPFKPSQLQRPPAADMLARIPADKLKVMRRYIFTLRYQKHVQEVKFLERIGTIYSVVTTNINRTRVVTNLGPPPYNTVLGQIIYGRRPLSTALAWPEAEALVKAEMSADMGAPADSIPGTVHSADLDYVGTLNLAHTTGYAAPHYPTFIGTAARTERAGQLRAVVVSKNKKYYIWKRVTT